MFKILFLLAFLAGIAGEVYVLYTGNKVIVWQSQAEAGAPVAVLGNNPAAYDMLVCRHFDGRTISTSLYRFAEDEVGGFKRCPLIIQTRDGIHEVKMP